MPNQNESTPDIIDEFIRRLNGVAKPLVDETEMRELIQTYAAKLSDSVRPIQDSDIFSNMLKHEAENQDLVDFEIHFYNYRPMHGPQELRVMVDAKGGSSSAADTTEKAIAKLRKTIVPAATRAKALREKADAIMAQAAALESETGI